MMSGGWPLEVSDLEEVLKEIEEARSKALLTAIGVEGYSTSGKTWLAEKICVRFGWTVLGTDAFLRRDCETQRYIECLDTEKLERAVSKAAPPLVIEGIALADSLDRIGLAADLTVYCKRISPAGLWVDDLLNHITEGVPNPDLSMVDYWAVEYHLRKDPVAGADLVFRWVEA
jgi:hypothetical protein